MDNVLAGVSMNIIIDPDPDNPPGPGWDVGEAKPGGVFESDSNPTSIFDY